MGEGVAAPAHAVVGGRDALQNLAVSLLVLRGEHVGELVAGELDRQGLLGLRVAYEEALARHLELPAVVAGVAAPYALRHVEGVGDLAVALVGEARLHELEEPRAQGVGIAERHQVDEVGLARAHGLVELAAVLLDQLLVAALVLRAVARLLLAVLVLDVVEVVVKQALVLVGQGVVDALHGAAHLAGLDGRAADDGVDGAAEEVGDDPGALDGDLGGLLLVAGVGGCGYVHRLGEVLCRAVSRLLPEILQAVRHGSALLGCVRPMEARYVEMPPVVSVGIILQH